jgi:hypothetical protein
VCVNSAVGAAAADLCVRLVHNCTLCCTVLGGIVLHCAGWYCATLRWAVLCCTALGGTVLYCVGWRYVVLRWVVLCYTALGSAVLYCAGWCCASLWCVVAAG